MIRNTAISFLVLVLLTALLPVNYQHQYRDSPGAAPSRQFPLGTDDLGRNRFARLIYGTRVSLLLAFAAALFSCAVAALLGGAAGLGVADPLILGMADLFLSLPWLFLLLTVRAFLPLNVSPLLSVTITFLLLGILGWAAPAKVVRASVRKLAASDFMLQARATGCSPSRLLFRHLIPNAMPILWAQLFTTIPAYVLAETTLGMLGLGVMEPLPSWGNLMRELEGGGIHVWQLAPVFLLAAVVGSFQIVLPREDYSA